MKKWVIGCGLALLMSIFTVVGLGYFGYVRASNWNTSRKAKTKADQAVVEAGIAQRRQYLETHLTQETRVTIPVDFYTHDGFRDWWRLPLVFPYQLMCIDTRDRACLQEYEAKYPVADPNKSSSGVLGDMTRVATDNRFLVFETRNGSTISYGMFRYESGIRSDFGKEAELWNAAKDAGYSGSHVLLKIDDLFTAYYDWNKTFVEQPAGGDGKPAPQP